MMMAMAIFLDANESDDGEIQFSTNFHIWGEKIECKLWRYFLLKKENCAGFIGKIEPS